METAGKPSRRDGKRIRPQGEMQKGRRLGPSRNSQECLREKKLRSRGGRGGYKWLVKAGLDFSLKPRFNRCFQRLGWCRNKWRLGAGAGQQDRALEPNNRTKHTRAHTLTRARAHTGTTNGFHPLLGWVGNAVSLILLWVEELPVCHQATGNPNVSTGVQGPDHLGSNPSYATTWLCDSVYLWGV